jgi:peptidoglycan/LPS O-acetylase OafA/YrhL
VTPEVPPAVARHVQVVPEPAAEVATLSVVPAGKAYHGGPQEQKAMEGLRLIAAVIVVWFHCQTVTAAIIGGGPPGMWIIRTGYFAVDALFVLSGFAQFLPFAAAGPEKKQDWLAYAIRRVGRIVPAYYVALVLTGIYIGHFSTGAGHSGKVVGVWELVIHALFLHNIFYGAGGQVGLGIDTAMWTLTAEAAFYVVLPFVARWFLRHPFWGLLGGAVVSGAWRLIFINSSSVYVMSQAPAFAFHFALGMAAAMVTVRLMHMARAGDRLAQRVKWAGLFTMVYATVLLAAWQRAVDPATHHFSQSYSFNDRFVWNPVPTTVFAILLCALAVAPPWSYWPIANRVVRWLGEGSYGLYLLHILVMLEMANLWKHLGHQPMQLWTFSLLCCAESALLGRLSFLLVEEPCRRLARNLAARRSRVRAPRSRARTRGLAQARPAADSVAASGGGAIS